MPVFEVTDRDGAVTIIDCRAHYISAASGEPVVHDFAGVRGIPTAPESGRFETPGELRFVAPISVREVPA